MRKSEILRGYGAFRAVMMRGTWVRSGLLRAAFLLETGGSDQVKVGISVPKRIAGAVKRNRARRLLREAIGRELQRPGRVLEGSGLNMTIVFQLQTITSQYSRKITLKEIATDVTRILQMIPLRAIGQ